MIEETYYFVRTECHPVTGIVIDEEWRKAEREAVTGTVGKLWKQLVPDRAGGPAVIRRDAETGIVTYELWLKDGKRDRAPADGPADIIRDPVNGRIISEHWWTGGERIAEPLRHRLGRGLKFLFTLQR